MIIQSKKVFIAGQFIPAQIDVSGGKIKNVSAYDEKEPTADYGSLAIVPGFIDVHTHGMLGYSTDDLSPEGLVNWLNKLPEEGVTSFLPTTTAQSKDTTVEALKNIATVKAQKHKGAEILGAHLEGPFLAPDFRGMHTLENLRAPSVGEFEEYQKATGGVIRYMTIACECDEGHELIKEASGSGVTVSIGHSGATFEQAILALANGASVFTHSFNAMSALHHRKPGAVGALMAGNAFAEIIADGFHVHPSVVKILFGAKGYSNIILISDAIGVKGLPEGTYDVSNVKVTLDKHGTARMFGGDTIAGSSLRINDGIQLLVGEAMVPIEQAILSATLNPAIAIGEEGRKGRIRSGNDADIVVIDGEFNVEATYCMGELVYSRRSTENI